MNTPPAEAPRELPLAVPLHENQRIAEILERIAELLEAQNASAFRARAYRHAAIELRLRRVGIREVFAVRGVQGLVDLPGIGLSIANVIAEYLQSGHVELLRRLEGHASPEDLFATLPGIGEELARRLHRELGVETLEDLESAAHDGRLEQVAGFGPRRVSALRDLLAARLARSPRSRRIRNESADAVTGAAPALDVATLLDLDAQYRKLAASGALHTIAPRRFNPRREAWLPIWHTERDGWHITALFSNTALAHQLGATRDWVILYYERDGIDGQCTVVTERRGPLSGHRVVRGREAECRREPEPTQAAPTVVLDTSSAVAPWVPPGVGAAITVAADSQA